MSGRDLSLGELELEVLKTVWAREPCTVREVAEIVGKERGSAYTTVLTVMQRLHAKGLLSRRKRRGVFAYSTTRARADVMSALVGRFVDRVLDGSAVPFVAYLAGSEGLTPEQAEALRRIARDLQQKQGKGRE
jgi:predicted transcriptional regulator